MEGTFEEVDRLVKALNNHPTYSKAKWWMGHPPPNWYISGAPPDSEVVVPLLTIFAGGDHPADMADQVEAGDEDFFTYEEWAPMEGWDERYKSCPLAWEVKWGLIERRWVRLNDLLRLADCCDQDVAERARAWLARR